MIWALYGLLHSFFRAAFTEAGRKMGTTPRYTVFLQAFFAALLLAPALPFVRWPDDLYFYYAAIGTALILSIGMHLQLALCAQSSGRLAALYMPIEALAGFGIWFLIAHSLPFAHSYSAVTLGGIAASYIIATVALLKIRRHDINWRTIAIMAPVGLTYAVIGAVMKMIVPPDRVFETAIVYAYLHFVIMASFHGMVLLVRGKDMPEKVTRGILGNGLLTACFSLLAYIAFIVAVTMAPNPGYISLLTMMMPVWLIIWHRLRGTEDDSKPLAALAIVLAVVLLLVVTLA